MGTLQLRSHDRGDGFEKVILEHHYGSVGLENGSSNNILIDLFGARISVWVHTWGDGDRGFKHAKFAIPEKHTFKVLMKSSQHTEKAKYYEGLVDVELSDTLVYGDFGNDPITITITAKQKKAKNSCSDPESFLFENDLIKDFSVQVDHIIIRIHSYVLIRSSEALRAMLSNDKTMEMQTNTLVLGDRPHGGTYSEQAVRIWLRSFYDLRCEWPTDDETYVQVFELLDAYGTYDKIKNRPDEQYFRSVVTKENIWSAVRNSQLQRYGLEFLKQLLGDNVVAWIKNDNFRTWLHEDDQHFEAFVQFAFPNVCSACRKNEQT